MQRFSDIQIFNAEAAQLFVSSSEKRIETEETDIEIPLAESSVQRVIAQDSTRCPVCHKIMPEDVPIDTTASKFEEFVRLKKENRSLRLQVIRFLSFTCQILVL